MMKSLTRISVFILGLALIAGGVCWAAGSVSSPVVNMGAAHGQPVYVPLKLSSTQAVAGVNGELTFDASLFTNPQIMKGQATTSFNVLGNLVSAGKYKFVVYADPTAAMSTNDPVVYFRFQVVQSIPHSGISTMTYTDAAASDTAAVSLTSTFGNIQINLESSSASDWAVYE